MKKFFVLLLCFVSFSVFSQEPCATEMPQEQMDWLREYKTNPFGTLKSSRSQNYYYVPVKVHIVGDDNGNGYYRPRFLLNTFCILREQFSQVGFHFYIKGEINYINNSSLYEHQGGIGNIVAANNDRNAVNIYFVEDPSGACGYYSGFGANPFVAIRKSCAGINNSTVAHELGHYFSLPHTFSGWEGRSANANATSNDERVDGSNCSFRGDLFCDTPADFISDRWNCPYNGTKVDFAGDPYEPDGTLFMSYANDACQNKFSPEQIDAMIEFLTDSRSFLLNQAVPDTAVGTLNELLLPANEATNVPSNYVQLKWNKVFNATHYYVIGTRFTNPNAYAFEFITTDTTLFLDNLTPGFRYRWRVQPFNGANTCTALSDEFAFTTTDPSDILPGVLVNKITCNGFNDGSISLNPIGGTPPYTYFWNNTATSASLTNLSPGNYSATVYGADNKEISVDIDLVNPDPINIDFTQAGSIVTAVPSGGTPPYSYLWHNGVTGVSVSVPGGGYYWVSITDANGCNSFRDSNGVTTVEEQQKPSVLRVYPNPVDASGKLVVEFSATKIDDLKISLFDFSGRMVFENNQSNLNTTSTKEFIDVTSFANGLYMLKITSGNESLMRKVIIQ